MDLKSIEKLPLQERIQKLKEFKANFASQKARLHDVIKELERGVLERQEFAKATTSTEKKILANEVKALTASIKEVKLRIQAKEDELKLVEKSLAEAEQHITKSEIELEANAQDEKTRLEMMIIEQRKKQEEDDAKRSLEEQVKQAEPEEEVKKQIDANNDYMKKQEENLYIRKTNDFIEEAVSGYQKDKPEHRKDEEPWKQGYEKKEKEEYKA